MKYILIIVYISLCIILFLNGRDNIPRIIHQTAPSDKNKWKPEWFDCQKSWISLHPDFKYMFWSDEDIEKFMKENYKQFYDEVFSHYDKHIKKVDAVRYFILRHYGGIYADMDYMCLNRFYEDLNKNYKAYIVESAWCDNCHENALMMSPKGHKFWDCIIDKLKENKDEESPFDATGNHLLDECAKDNKDVITLRKNEYSPSVKGQGIENFPNAKAYHLGSCSWC